MQRKETAIVFGGSGFLGSHVADALDDFGFNVRVYDIRPSPYLRPSQHMIVGDILDVDAVTAATDGCKFVYNFAGMAGIDDARNQPLEAVKLNLLGMLNTLEAARQFCARRYIFASSVYVFSKNGSFYRATKQAAEIFIQSYHERYSLPFTILRYGSLYGRRADERNGIYRMVHDALNSGVIRYDGPEQAVREYIHATDAAALSVRILDDAYENRHVVLTGQERFAVRDIMQMIANMVPGPVKIRFEDSGAEDHYTLTPYSFQPAVGRKLTTNNFVDLGQGILDCLTEAYERIVEKPALHS